MSTNINIVQYSYFKSFGQHLKYSLKRPFRDRIQMRINNSPVPHNAQSMQVEFVQLCQPVPDSLFIKFSFGVQRARKRFERLDGPESVLNHCALSKKELNS
jgi:hypothetical protein